MSSAAQPWGSPLIRSVLPVPRRPSDRRGGRAGLFLRCDVLVPRTRCSQIVAGPPEEECGCHGACQGECGLLEVEMAEGVE